MRLLLTRHYKTLDNVSQQILGWGDSPHIDGWQADMEFVVGRLRRVDISPDVIYSSDLKRSRLTAEYYANLLGIKAVCSSAALNEVNYGHLHKKKKKWVADHYPLHKKDPDFVYPGGECFRAMQRRSVDYLLTLTARHAAQTLLIVGHSGIIRGFISYFLGLNYAEHLQHKIPHRYIGDFHFDGGRCISYDELGKPSGFVQQGVIKVPFAPQAAGVESCGRPQRTGLSAQPADSV